MKTRSMIADACRIACTERYDPYKGEWESLGEAYPVLYISTEMELEEVHTMCVAYVSGINEELFLNGQVDFDSEVIQHSIDVVESSLLKVQTMPDFTVKDIENCIRRNFRVNKTSIVFFDYINTSLGLIADMGNRAKGTALREDQVLYLLSTRLKELAVDMGIFILSATQVNMSWQESTTPDASLLRGSKAIADKLDFGCILLPIMENDKQPLSRLTANGYPMPNAKISVYKNRRGSFTRSYLWLDMDKGTCRYKTLFATDWDYNHLDVSGFNVEQV